jgi:hypothetical protein
MSRTGRSCSVNCLLALLASTALRAQGTVPTITPLRSGPEIPSSGPTAIVWGGLGLIGTALTGDWPQAPSSHRPGASTRNDGRSVSAIVSALYGSVSHDHDSTPDWARMRKLFLHGGIIVSPGSPDEKRVRILSVKAFQRQVDAAIHTMKMDGQSPAVIEREIARRVACFGNVCQVLSTYESRHARSDPAPFARGVNSIQIVEDGRRWWIVSVTWDTERPDKPIPSDYLRSTPVTTAPGAIPAEYLRHSE